MRPGSRGPHEHPHKVPLLVSTATAIKTWPEVLRPILIVLFIPRRSWGEHHLIAYRLRFVPATKTRVHPHLDFLKCSGRSGNVYYVHVGWRSCHGDPILSGKRGNASRFGPPPLVAITRMTDVRIKKVRQLFHTLTIQEAQVMASPIASRPFITLPGCPYPEHEIYARDRN
jgi:hypothetical protein